ncbi:MAG: PfkB family carbohydrate kinase [Thermoprotei archaeon]
MKDKPLHICVGNLNIDITFFVDKIPDLDEAVIAGEAIFSPGGSASNYAVATACYGHRSALVASTSTSPLVDDIIEELRRRGVIVDYIKRVEGIPGLVFVVVTSKGEKIMFKYRGLNELLSPNDVPRELLSEANIVHIASIPPRLAREIAERAIKMGVLVSYDPGAYATMDKDEVLHLLNIINIVFLNRVEAKTLTGGNLEKLLKYNIDYIVIKKGSAGAFVLEHGNKYYYGVSKPIGKPINATGAGDAFDAFFNAALLDYNDAGKALQYGLAGGAYKTLSKTSIIECNRGAIKKQLDNTFVEITRKPESWVLED